MLLRRITIGLMLCALLASAPGIRSTPAMAHPGGTASDGCHYCRTNCSSWGDPYGVRHCHGGGSPTTSPTPTAPPPPPPPPPIDREFARQQVSRLYLAYFLRYADDAGREYWVGRMVAGLTLIQMSDEFARSPEFGTLYGSLDNAFFVDLVYRNVLGRAPDVAGHTYWTTALNDRTLSRGAVMLGFSESIEFITRVG